MRRLQHAASFLAWLVALPFLFVMEWLPEPVALAFARRIGRTVYWLLPNDRRWCDFNLRVAYGDSMDAAGRRQLAQAVFEHHAITFCEILRMTPRWIDERVVVDGFDIVQEYITHKKPAIVVSGHLGNWEVMPAFFQRRGASNVLLTRPLDNPFFERMLNRVRRRCGTEPVARSLVGSRQAIHAVRAGKVLSIAIDQNQAKGGVFAHWFGVPAATARGAATIALKENVDVGVVVTYRLPDGRHQIVVRGPIELIRTGDEEADIVANMQRFTNLFEEYVAAHPEQYHWQHGRYRTRPDGESWRSTDDPDDRARDRSRPARRAPAPWAIPHAPSAARAA